MAHGAVHLHAMEYGALTDSSSGNSRCLLLLCDRLLGHGCAALLPLQVTGFFVLESFVSRVTDGLLGPQEAAQVSK